MHFKHNNVLFRLQLHIKILESAPENISLLLVGLGYLISISYVDDTEVFKVCELQLLILFSVDAVLGFSFIFINYQNGLMFLSMLWKLTAFACL